MATRWDVIVLSAMDENQKSAFENQLDLILKDKMMAEHLRVFADEPKGVKIGACICLQPN